MLQLRDTYGLDLIMNVALPAPAEATTPLPSAFSEINRAQHEQQCSRPVHAESTAYGWRIFNVLIDHLARDGLGFPVLPYGV